MMLAAALACAAPVQAQLELSVSPTPVGAGARAAGMANAFTAVADDATAASWNPAGLVQLERPEISIVGAYGRIDDVFASGRHPEIGSRHSRGAAELNFASVVLPSPWPIFGRTACVSLSYQRKYDFGRDFAFDYGATAATAIGTLATQGQRVRFEQSGGLGAVSPAAAIGLTPRLSIGAAVNLWYSTPFGQNDWEQQTASTGLALFGPLFTVSRLKETERYEGVSGQNVTLGLLWRPTDRWHVALRYDSPMRAKAKYDRRTRTQSLSLGGGRPLPARNAVHEEEDRELRFPSAIAFGTAYRFNDRLTLACDVTRIDWDGFYVETGRGARQSLVNGLFDTARTAQPDFDPAWSARLGMEYVFVPKQPEEVLGSLWSLRGGAFFEQEPASGFRDRGRAASGDPDEFLGAAIGAGCLVRQRVNFDVAYQARWGRGVNEDFVRGVRGFETDTIQHRVLLSTVIYF